MATPRASLLSADEARRALGGLPGWTLAPDGKSIRREYVLEGFSAAAELVGRIAPAADDADHHPDLHLTGYRRLVVELTTHDAGGLTEKDLAMARTIEALPRKEKKPS